MDPVKLPIPSGDFKAYLFDLDGTVADTMPMHFIAWTKAIEEAGGSFPDNLFYAWAGVPLIGVVENLNQHFGFKLDPPSVVHRKESLYLEMLDKVTPIACVVEHVHARHGEIPLAIVSGSPRNSIQKTLTTLGLLDYFDVLVGSEDYAKGKPHPEPFLTAAKLLNVAPEACLVFEDADAGIKSAEAAGMQWVRVPVPAPVGK